MAQYARTSMAQYRDAPDTVYRRYAIAAEADLREGVAKLAALKRGEPQGTVIPLPAKAEGA